MKNPVFFTNKSKPQVINIYQYSDNKSFLQLATLNENETTILNIPKETYIIVTAIECEAEKQHEQTLFESILSYHNHFRF